MKIEKVAVIGAGVMGAGIAAQIANAGIPVLLLDVVDSARSNRNAMAAEAIKKMSKITPPPLMLPRNARLITAGNCEDDLSRLVEVDWIIEAVVENLSVKQSLYHRLHKVCRNDTLISSNTSTLPLRLLVQGMPSSFSRRFIITHFFNPPRYMRLLELVAAPDVDAELLEGVASFAFNALGKDWVLCHDTPGFIANRIGSFWLQTALLHAIELNLTVEQCDAAMTLLGVPKTGVFGLMDLIGIDLLPLILKNFALNLPADDSLSIIAQLPPVVESMLAQGLIGRKGIGGFYRLQPGVKQKIKQAIDLQTGSYRRSEPFKIADVGDDAEALRTFLNGKDTLSRYTWKVLSETLVYTASLIPQIADDIEAVDRAMRLGFNWRYGPFELVDFLGMDWIVQRLRHQGQDLPELLKDKQSCYRYDTEQIQYKDHFGHYHTVQRPHGVFLLQDIKLRSKPLLTNASASLWNIGDGVVCLEFHTKMNTLDESILNSIGQAVKLVEAQYQALVIYNEAANFSVGANLQLLVSAIKQQQFDNIEKLIRFGQETFRSLKYAPFPVVGAPSGMALGGGCEILLHCDAIQAHAELYMGLVEVGVGLVPAWGGCKELLRRWQACSRCPGGPLPAVAKCFEMIGMAKISQSAQEAKSLMFLSKQDGITMNRDRLLTDAKAKALALQQDYHPPQPASYSLAGRSARAALGIAVHAMHLAGKASAYDVEISRHLAAVLTGGDADITQPLSEQAVLDLELRSFMSLLQQPGTLARLEHMLKTGKPLRN